MWISERIPTQLFAKKGTPFRHPAYWVPVLLGALIALFAGSDVLNRYDYLSTFVNFMSAVVPSIPEWGLNSEIRQPIMLYLSVLWLFVPIQCWLALNSRAVMESLIVDWKLKKGKRFYGPLLATILILPCTYMFLTVGLDSEDGCVRYCITGSRWALAAVGFLLPTATAMGWAILLSPFRYFGRLYLKD